MPNFLFSFPFLKSNYFSLILKKHIINIETRNIVFHRFLSFILGKQNSNQFGFLKYSQAMTTDDKFQYEASFLAFENYVKT